jgi:Uma2 family endonuclease
VFFILLCAKIPSVRNSFWYQEAFVMALTPTKITLLPEEYLQAEQSSDVKHEYDNGYIFAMVGASRAHNLIALTVASEMKQHLKGKPCRTYMSDMKVRIQANGNDLFYYPDVMVSCDDQPPSEYYEDKPVLIVEILSPSTETRDKLEKLAAYSSIFSLLEYFTIAQDRVEIGRYTMADSQTILTQYGDGDRVEFSSIGLSMLVKDIYADVAGQIL